MFVNNCVLQENNRSYEMAMMKGQGKGKLNEKKEMEKRKLLKEERNRVGEREREKKISKGVWRRRRRLRGG